uniref:ZNF616 protein n=1 Tax=Homo sapiens TaxID=9606 RepID=Q08AN0_HUMAN|nr:ZNF616 protein [Homo sapiens]
MILKIYTSGKYRNIYMTLNFNGKMVKQMIKKCQCPMKTILLVKEINIVKGM